MVICDPLSTMKVVVFDFASPEYAEAVRLRYEVLRKPLGLYYSPPQIAREWRQMHLGLIDTSGRVQGSVSLARLSGKVMKIRQMAIAPAFQGKGYGRRLLNAAEQWAHFHGAHCVQLHARYYAVGFYQRCGYHIISSPFQEIGMPHYRMSKLLGITH